MSFWAFFRQVCDLQAGGTRRQIQDEFGEGVDEGVGRMGGAIDGVQAADRKPGEKYIKYPLLRRFHALMLKVTSENVIFGSKLALQGRRAAKSSSAIAPNTNSRQFDSSLKKCQHDKEMTYQSTMKSLHEE